MGGIPQIMAKVRGVLLRRGVAAQEADDILQEAFARLEAYTRTHELRSQEAFLVTTAVNISRDQLRRKQHAPPETGDVALETLADQGPQPDEHALAKERLRRASAGLARLDDKARRCLLAQRLEGLTFPQIAAREGVSVAAVEKRVARAVMFLTQWMAGW
jgi:RNA polymerase sigma-70 factor (ECF subfamily)